MVFLMAFAAAVEQYWLLILVPACCCCCCSLRLARRDAATGEVRIGIFTRRSVAEDEELTYDYMFEHYGVSGMAQGFKCQCGAKNCRWAKTGPAC